MTEKHTHFSAESADLIQFAAHMARLLYNDATLDDCTEEQKRAWLSAAKALMTIYEIRTRNAAQPSVEAMKAAVELEIALGRVQTVEIGRMIQKAIDASQPSPVATVDPACSGCAGITHTHTCGDFAKSPQLRCSAGTEDDPGLTPTRFVDDILSACDASNWDADRNKGDYYRGLRDAYEAIHEIAGEYQKAMYKWTRLRHLAGAANALTSTEPQAALMQKIEAEARRYAEMYPQSSDGRNTFVIFADWVASQGGGKTHPSAVCLILSDAPGVGS